MNRNDALILIANQLDFLNGKFNGVRDTFTREEIQSADVILTTLEEAGIIKNSNYSDDPLSYFVVGIEDEA